MNIFVWKGCRYMWKCVKWKAKKDKGIRSILISYLSAEFSRRCPGSCHEEWEWSRVDRSSSIWGLGSYCVQRSQRAWRDSSPFELELRLAFVDRLSDAAGDKRDGEGILKEGRSHWASLESAGVLLGVVPTENKSPSIRKKAVKVKKRIQLTLREFAKKRFTGSTSLDN